MHLVVFTDGASRGNPGPASFGFVIKTKSGVILHQEGKTIGVQTNNFAEYTGLLSALTYIEKYLAKESLAKVECFLDSQLVVSQLNGIYKIKKSTLQTLNNKIKEISKILGFVTFTHIPRSENLIADKLANIALDK